MQRNEFITKQNKIHHQIRIKIFCKLDKGNNVFGYVFNCSNYSITCEQNCKQCKLMFKELFFYLSSIDMDHFQNDILIFSQFVK